MTEWLKWWQTIKISWSNLMAYKLSFFLMFIGPPIVFFLIKYNVWHAIYQVTPSMAGYDFEQMIVYQFWVMIVSLLGQGHSSLNLAVDIRWGRISRYLLYPFGLWQNETCRFLAFQWIQTMICLFTLLLVWTVGLVSRIELGPLITGLGMIYLVSSLWFLVMFWIGLLSFWFEDTWMFRVILVIVTAFCSGGIMPLEIFPHVIQDYLMWTPFPYMTYYPAKVFMGQPPGPLVPVVGVVLLWGGAMALLTRWTWQRGLRLYTAAGI